MEIEILICIMFIIILWFLIHNHQSRTKKSVEFKRTTIEPSKEDILLRIDALVEYGAGEKEEIYNIMINYNENLEKKRIFRDLESLDHKYITEDERVCTIYHLRYENLNYIKAMTKQKKYNYLNSLPWPERCNVYSQSSEWNEKKKIALNLANNKCQLCSSEDVLQVYHNTYDRFGNELLSDLIVLCSKCAKHHHKTNYFMS